MSSADPPVLVHVTRDGVVESAHTGDVAVADDDGRLLAELGAADQVVYPRSAIKPFQALASLLELHAHGLELPTEALAIACGSHTGSGEHQIEAAHVLALAGLDESALRCPPDWPTDPDALREQPAPTPLAYNCSGKHAAFLLAHTAAGNDPAGYLDRTSPLQQRVRDVLADVSGGEPAGPGTDGCGAPAWRLPLHAVATAFARLAVARGPHAPLLASVRAAMTARPDLVGGVDAADTRLMLRDGRVVAKRGAEGVLAAGFSGPQGGVGVAVKIRDGAGRASHAPVAAVLDAVGARVPDSLLRVDVLGGGRPHGTIEAAPALQEWAGRLQPYS